MKQTHRYVAMLLILFSTGCRAPSPTVQNVQRERAPIERIWYYAGEAAAADKQQSIVVVGDRKRRVTCWITHNRLANGLMTRSISCLPFIDENSFYGGR